MKKTAAKDASCNGLGLEAGGDERKTQLRLKTLLDVRRFLARVLNDLDADRIQESKANVLGYLCSTMKVIRKTILYYDSIDRAIEENDHETTTAC